MGEIDEFFVDHVSGKNRNRPELTDCLWYLRNGGTLVVASTGRFARNLVGLRQLVDELTGVSQRV